MDVVLSCGQIKKRMGLLYSGEAGRTETNIKNKKGAGYGRIKTDDRTHRF